MKRIAVAGVFSFTILLSACSGDKAERAASGAASQAVELAKGVATGIGSGVEEGRKASPSADGARIVSAGTELTAALRGEILEVRAVESSDAALSGTGQRTSAVVMAFANAANTPVRVIELGHNHRVTALDKAGFACVTRRADNEFTVPPKSKFKLTLEFDCEDIVGAVRLYGVEYAAPVY